MPSPSTTASSPDSPPSQAVPPPSNSSSNSSSPPSSSPSPPSPSSSPSPPLQSSPPPEKSQPAPPPPQSPPPSKGSSPPPSNGSPPPPSNGSPPPPSSSDASPPPPPDNSSGSSPPQTVSPPPPPHSSGRSPPPPPHKVSPSSVSDNSSSSSSGSNNSLPLIVGVTVGVGLLLIAMILICRSCLRKKKRKPGLMEMQYYGDPSQNGGGYYTNPTQPSWHHSPQGMNHVVRLSTPPGGPVGPPAGGAWPSPPPPMMMPTSGEMSSSFSGPYKPPLPPPSPNISLGFNKSTFSYEELAAATIGFSQANLLGQGGFGYVHKGVFPNGQEVAVKSLKSGSGQGEREFQAEVEIISRVHHRHLVSLVGYCIADGQRMLVYEFVSNKTLEYHLHGNGRPTMDWSTRLRIGVGSSKGLAYLHEDCHPRIIHRDIKAANILLDDNFEAMVADFGLAKLSSDNYTHVSTRVMGTFGYLAPEYASSGKLTEKSDVFSYGVMLLELITGKRPVDPSSTMDDSLVDWARPLLARALEEGEYDELVDPKLENNYNPNEMARMVACAAASIRHSARRRPKMSQIARALEGDTSLLEDLKDGVKPGQSSVFSSNGSSEYDTAAYNTDMKKFRKMALMSSQEFASSESSNEFREGNGTNQKNYL